MGVDMTVKKLVIITIANLFLAILMLSPAYALRCGGRIVSPGDTSMQVVEICGQPDQIETREETHYIKDYRYHKDYRSKGWRRSPFLISKTIQIEEWIYNFGPTQFMRHLIFMSGRLEKIETGDKGYYR